MTTIESLQAENAELRRELSRLKHELVETQRALKICGKTLRRLFEELLEGWK